MTSELIDRGKKWFMVNGNVWTAFSFQCNEAIDVLLHSKEKSEIKVIKTDINKK